jgi:hypothetical protein
MDLTAVRRGSLCCRSPCTKSGKPFAIEAQNVGVTGELKPAVGAIGEVMAARVGCRAGYRLK